MAKLFSDTLINDVLDRCNIVELIQSYLPLKRAGRNYKAPCPFHAEKTPSFIVSADKPDSAMGRSDETDADVKNVRNETQSAGESGADTGGY